MKTLIKVALVATLTLGVTANAAKDRVWATGSDAGNYKPMSLEILEVCKNTDPRRGDFVLPKTGGSVENIHLGTTKKARIFWASMGTLIQEAKTNRKLNEKNWKIIYPMYVEPLNFLIPKDWRPKSNKTGMDKWMSKASGAFDKAMGNKKQPIKLDLNILKGQDIASSGGSVKEVEALVASAGLKSKVHALDTAELASSGMPVILVGGAPYKPVENLLASGKYFLVSIDINSLNRGATYFEKTSVSYKVGKKYKSIPTIGVRAMLMGKVAKKKHKSSDVKDQGMRTLAACIEDNVDDIAEDSDNSNWENVVEFKDGDDIPEWAMFKAYRAEGSSGDSEDEEADD